MPWTASSSGTYGAASKPRRTLASAALSRNVTTTFVGSSTWYGQAATIFAISVPVLVSTGTSIPTASPRAAVIAAPKPPFGCPASGVNTTLPLCRYVSTSV